MQVKLGPLVSEAAGSIGGTTFQRSPIATQVRSKPLPTRRRTYYTARERGNMQALTRLWGTLTQSTRDQWQLDADALTWTNKFGDVIRGKGYWLFIRCNQYLQMLGTANSTTNPGTPTLDAIASPAGVFTPALRWNISWSAPSTPTAGQVWAVFASRPMSPGRSQQFGTLRYVGNIRAGETSPKDMASSYTARFGSFPPANRVVFTRLVPIVIASGFPGVPVEFISTT